MRLLIIIKNNCITWNKMVQLRTGYGTVERWHDIRTHLLGVCVHYSLIFTIHEIGFHQKKLSCVIFLLIKKVLEVPVVAGYIFGTA